MKLLATVAWWISAIGGCAQTIAFTMPNTEELSVSVYVDGRPTAQCEIAPGSERHGKLTSWLAQNKQDWKASPADFAPKLLVSGKAFSINFVGSFVALNSEAGQYVHSVEPNQYEFLLCEKRT